MSGAMMVYAETLKGVFQFSGVGTSQNLQKSVFSLWWTDELCMADFLPSVFQNLNYIVFMFSNSFGV
jgi:hypothetical protein